jgi:2-amino-4-hydroxy-6-hydroxymethyldihydropteridine diphosphokinase
VAIWQPAYIGIGSNLADPRAQVLAAMERISTVPDVQLVLRSSLYGSHPLGPAGQPDFVNAAVGVLTRLQPLELLHELRAIEQQFGRPAVRERWGPRILDLDLLVHGRIRSRDSELLLPHPGIVERNFVLYPLAEIAPELEVPGIGRVIDLKTRISSEGIWALQGARAPTTPGTIASPSGSAKGASVRD